MDISDTIGLPLCEAWFEVEPVTEGLTCLTEPHVDVLLRSNVWLVEGRDLDLLVDTGNGLAPLKPLVDRLRGDRDKPILAVATHGHIDHAGGLHEFEQRLLHAGDAPVAMNPEPMLVAADVWPGARDQMADAGYPVPGLLLEARPAGDFDAGTFRPAGTSPTRMLADGDVLELGDRTFEVLHLPGHTHGSIGLWDAERAELFSGDAVYVSDPLIDTAPTSDISAYLDSMGRLRGLPAEVVYAGHDASLGPGVLKARCEHYIATRGPASGRG